MRFVTFQAEGRERFGLALEAGILDLKSAEGILVESGRLDGEPVLPGDLLGLIRAGEEVLPRVKEIAAAAGGEGSQAEGEGPQAAGERSHAEGPLAPAVYGQEQVRLLAPIGRPPRNIICLGLNYHAHAVEYEREFVQSKVPDAPVFFSKLPSTVIGPGAPIPTHPGLTEEVDYEAELAVVVGRQGRNIPREEAEKYVFGYTAINDVTARDLQKKHLQWLKGKSLDGFAPMGPVLVHRSAIRSPKEGLAIRTRVNGEVRQESDTSLLIFDIPAIIAELSAGITLEPGDIIATGTPAGVGMGMKPPRFLKSGDVVEVEIEGIGVLRNPVE